MPSLAGGDAGDEFEPRPTWAFGYGWMFGGEARRAARSGLAGDYWQGDYPAFVFGLTNDFLGGPTANYLGGSMQEGNYFATLFGTAFHVVLRDELMLSAAPELGLSALTFDSVEGWDQTLAYGVAIAATAFFEGRGFFRLQARVIGASHTSGTYVFLPITASVGIEL